MFLSISQISRENTFEIFENTYFEEHMRTAASMGRLFRKVQQSSVQPQACNFIKKETVAQVFSCEFCEISKSTFFYRTPPVAAS